jgi:hypothetical protein
MSESSALTLLFCTRNNEIAPEICQAFLTENLDREDISLSRFRLFRLFLKNEFHLDFCNVINWHTPDKRIILVASTLLPTPT